MRITLRVWWLLTCAIAQWNMSGSVHPITLQRISDGSAIQLPFRIIDVDLGYSIVDIELVTQSALEHRWSGSESEFDLREAYVIWFPAWGEVKIGKQIHAWGAVDGNNPTDNLNPYNYYYMFLAGTDRKIGSLSTSIKYYWDNWQLEAVIIPEHVGNRIPYDEPDFPISQSTDELDPRDFMKETDKDLEYGLKIGTTVGNSDMNVYYFNGRDRSFALGGYGENNEASLLPMFTYRKTTMLAVDLVTFIGDLTFRGETAHFHTENDMSYIYKNDLEASYLQFSLQLEYMTENDHIITAQVIGNIILSVSGTIFEPMENSFIKTTEDDLSMGMGTPFAMLSDQGAFLAWTGNYLDNSLELSVNTFVDMEDPQRMLGFSITYSPKENWGLEFGFSKFSGEEGTRFQEMQDFSHSSLGVKYSF